MREFVLSLIFIVSFTDAKIHHFHLNSDERKNIVLSTFGYLMQGTLEVKVDNFSFVSHGGVDEDVLSNVYKESRTKVGFTLSQGDEIPEFLRTSGKCFLDEEFRQGLSGGLENTVFFIMDFPSGKLRVIRRGTLKNLEICESLTTSKCEGSSNSDANRMKRAVKSEDNVQDPNEENTMAPDTEGKGTVKSSTITSKRPTKPMISDGEEEPEESPKMSTLVESLPMIMAEEDVSTGFSVRIWTEEEEGEYYLIYHNCRNYDPNARLPVVFTMSITEKNEESYLPAGEIPKPSLYFGIAALFFVTGIVWVHMLRARKNVEIYKVHYLMTALVFLKSCSLLFHGVNFHFISLYGHQQEVWAVVFYIMHLLKGALLFGTIILIGTGYTFFKNFLTERDRKLFMLIIPLQVLDNVAMIIIDETDEGQRNYKFWLQLFIFIDLICCAAIILPVIWSIRHLQEASQTDGKAAFNLEKLRLFRHFYILIICYIYLTRIIRYLVSFTVPFAYTWMVVVVEEVGTWFFFVVTGYKFKPAPDNPYLKLSQSDDEEDMDTPLTQSGALEGVTRIKRGETKETTMDEWDASTDIKQPNRGAKQHPVDNSGPDIDSA